MKPRLSNPGFLFAVLLLPLVLGTGPCRKDLLPIIFVHGGSGSGAQFESQAMRFTSNGYPQNFVRVLEYDSSAINSILPQVLANLDTLIADVQADTGAEKVVLIGHSLGTTVSHAYLATPERAAKIAKYVNIDGRTADAPPGGVPTLALWAGAIPRNPAPQIVGATNVTIPNQEHVQTATSEESFFEIYHFLHNRAPLITKILPELRPTLNGRVTNFPQNTGLDGATLEVWLVDAHSGERIGSHPRDTFLIGPDGTFGPLKVWNGLHYEFAVLRQGQVSINYYFEPFLHDDDLIRLNVAGGLAPFIASGPNHTALTVVRQKEFWGDRGAENDVLAVGGTDVVNPTSAPSGAVGTASVSFFLFDVATDGVSHVPGPVPQPFAALAFLTAQDLFIPSTPAGSVEVETVPRGDASETRTIHVPNLPSSEARVVVQLNDFEQ